MKRIFLMDDGSVRIMSATRKIEENKMSEYFNTCTSKIPELKNVPFKDVEDSEIPSDRSNRSLWTHANGKIVEKKNG